MNSCGKYQWNPSTTYRDITVCETDGQMYDWRTLCLLLAECWHQCHFTLFVKQHAQWNHDQAQKQSWTDRYTEQGLTSHQAHYSHIGDEFLRVKWLKCCGEEPHRVGYQKRQALRLPTSVRYNTNHVLHQLLPPVKDTHYNLRQRSHSLTLPSEDNNLIRKNFLHTMLFRDIY